MDCRVKPGNDGVEMGEATPCPGRGAAQAQGA